MFHELKQIHNSEKNNFDRNSFDFLIEVLLLWKKIKFQCYFDSFFSDAHCKHFFINYRGLQTLGHWMTELQGQNELELNLMESVVDVLALLSIPDKQVLNETGIWQIISKLDAGADVEVINEVSRDYV